MAEKIAVRREHTGSREGDAIQAMPTAVARKLNAMPFVAGVLVKNLAFTAGVDLLVSHGLGRRPSGVFIVRDYGANVCTGIGESTTQAADLTKTIKLRSPTTSTVDLWIF